jgi:uncharacterized membrane protein
MEQGLSGEGPMSLLAVDWPISFARPVWLLLLLTIPVIVFVSLRWLNSLDRTRRRLAILARCAVIAAVAVALARIEFVRRNDNVAAMFLIDRSRSIPDERRDDAEEYIRRIIRNADRDDRVGVIGFDGEAKVELMASRGGFEVVGFGMPAEPDRTDIAAGMRMAMAAFPAGFSRRIVLMTDGNQNVGNLVEEIEAAAANEVGVDVVPLRYEYENEVLFDRVSVPSHTGRDTKVPLRLVLKSQEPTRVRLSLYHNGVELPLGDPELDLTGDMKPDPFTIPIELQQGGVHRFEAVATPLNEWADAIPENNRATAFTFVEDIGRVLILTQPGNTDNQVLAQALAREKIDVELRSVQELPIDLLKLQEYSSVILANVSADMFTREQHEALASYVRDFGGGMIMTGGDDAYGAGGWIGTPIEEVSPVSFEIKHRKKIPQGALAIVMHSCELPRGNYWGEEVAVAAIKAISSRDYAGVIAYSWSKSGPNWEVPLQIASNKAGMIRNVRGMEIGDMPDFGTTMSITVRDLMQKTNASQRHIIIISDGDPQPPSAATIQKMINNRITCSTVGIGYGSHVMEQPLRDIANKTGGNFYPVKNPRRLPQIFIKEARTVKRALLDDRDFQPLMPFAPPEMTLGVNPEELPPLGGLVVTEAKADALVPLIRQVDVEGDLTTDPVLAYWNFEMGKMAAFTSGWWPRWGSSWAAWEKFGKFWAQVARWSMRQEGSANFEIITRRDGNQGHVVVEALNKETGFLNFLQMKGTLLAPDMDRKPLQLMQTGPGRYEGTFDVDNHGNYLINLQYSDGRETSGMIRTGLSVPYSPEFRELGTNTALLEEAVRRTGGQTLSMDPKADDIFRRDLPPAVSRQPIWRWVVTWLLLPLFLLDVAVRRLASNVALSVYVELAILAVFIGLLIEGSAPWWGYLGAVLLAELVGWYLRREAIGPLIRYFTAGVSPQASQRSAATLSQLKGVQRGVRDELTGRAEGEGESTASTATFEQTADKKRRFDVGDAEGDKPADDLTQTLGGADTAELERKKSVDSRQEQKKDDAPDAGGLSRLREAKKRAREEFDERNRSDEE